MSGFSEFEEMQALVPDDGVMLSCLRIVRYMDTDGEEQIRMKCDGEASIATSIGMLELVKHSYIVEAGPMEVDT